MAEATPHRIFNHSTERVAFMIGGEKDKDGRRSPRKIIEIGGKDDIGIVGAQPNPCPVSAADLAAIKATKSFKALEGAGTLRVQ